MANEYELPKKEALKQARQALSETYDVDLNVTNIIQAVKDLGIAGFEAALNEIRNFVAATDKKLVAASDANQIGVIMANARVKANWDNPLYDYVEDIA